LQIAPTRSIRLRTEIPGPVARELLARHAKIASLTEEPFPIIAKKAHGTLIYDVDGNVLIDFSGRAGLTGYTPDHLVETLRDGVENLIDVPNGTSKAAIELAERLVSLVPGAEKAMLYADEFMMLDAFGKIMELNPNAYINDELKTGFGKTGEFWNDAHPADAFLLQDFAAGFPIYAVVGRAEWLDQLRWNSNAPALTCAAALSVIDYIIANDLPRRAAQIEERFLEKAEEWGHPTQLWGRGVLRGISLKSREARDRAYTKALNNGLILGKWHDVDLSVEPPLMCPEEQLNEALDVLRDALDW
jgi:4-aminobutyrate aminotransferase-like enzyme